MHYSNLQNSKYLFYAIVFDVAGNTTPVGSSTSPTKTITTNIQKVTGITINPSSAQTKNIGDTFGITATVSPSDANNKGVTWSSSSTSVATVDSSGNVRCVSAGTTTITATASDGSGKSASLSLTVRDPLTSLTLDKPQTTLLYGGATTTVTATTTPSDYDANNLTWSIGDNSLATISGSGKTRTITSNNTKKTGETTLTVSGSGKTATMKVNIVNFTTTTYSYTGSVQHVDLPAGTYKLECWGAQGGNNYIKKNSTFNVGNYGGYSVGVIKTTSNTTLYVYVGGAGNTLYKANNRTDWLDGGWNGGGAYDMTYNTFWSSYDCNCHSGGGATDICTIPSTVTKDSYHRYIRTTESYNSRIIVAGGGGGYCQNYSTATGRCWWWI